MIHSYRTPNSNVQALYLKVLHAGRARPILAWSYYKPQRIVTKLRGDLWRLFENYNLLLFSGARTMLRLLASTPLDTLLTASRGRKGFLYIHSPPSTTMVAPAQNTHAYNWPDAHNSYNLTDFFSDWNIYDSIESGDFQAGLTTDLFFFI